MKILCLYGNECAVELWKWLESKGYHIICIKEKLDDAWLKKENIDLAISYTYPYIIKQSSIDILNGNIVNLHTSFLPYNRGSYPNVWSILEDTPRGVTLHYIDQGLDSGDIISQVVVPLEKGMTLKSSYEQLDVEARELFKKSFTYYSHWQFMRKKVLGKGTFHTDKDFFALRDSFSEWSWEIPIEKFKLIISEQEECLK